MARTAWNNAFKLWELSVIAPQVIAHRVVRMSMAGPRPSARDRRELTRMGQEKIDAFGQSLLMMSTALVLEQQAVALDAARQWWAYWGVGGGRNARQHRTARIYAFPTPRLQASPVHRILGKGIAPIHRRARANLRRLGKPSGS